MKTKWFTYLKHANVFVFEMFIKINFSSLPPNVHCDFLYPTIQKKKHLLLFCDINSNLENKTLVVSLQF